MSIVRVNGYTPLKRIKDSWEDLYDPEGLDRVVKVAKVQPA
jgi:hypothetical protein